MSPRDVLIATSLGGSLLGIGFMVLGSLMLSAGANTGGNPAVIDVYGGSVLFLAGSAFVLFSAILIPALRAIRAENSPTASNPPPP